MKQIFVINVHSFIDVITNSSTEMFIIDKSKLEESIKQVFDAIVNQKELDYESKVTTWEDYRWKEDIILPEGTCVDDCYVIDVSHSNDVLYMLVEKFFKPLDIKYID